MAYVFYDEPERVDRSLLTGYCATISLYILSSYLAWMLWEFLSLLPRNENRVDLRSLKHSPRLFLWLVGSVGFGATAVCSLLPSVAGAMIVFQVLKNFTYPVFLASIIGMKRNDSYHSIVTFLSAGVLGTSAFFSPWRSELIVFMLTIAIALLYLQFSKRSLVLTFATFSILIFLSLPFLQAKKIDHNAFVEDPLGVFVKSQEVDFETRGSMFLSFFGSRVNALREVAYVANGLDAGLIEAQFGATYKDTLYQLIPRFFWPDKPSFNQALGFTLPRDVGLLGREDQSTSWAVNIYGEAVYNFGVSGILWFLPLVFFASTKIDSILIQKIAAPTSRILCSVTLFFLTLQMVSLVSAVTYIVWALIFSSALVLIERRCYLHPF